MGLWERYYRTLRRSVLELPRFAAELPAQGSLRRALTFALLPTSVSVMIAAAAVSVLFGLITSGMQNAQHSLSGAALGGVMFLGYTWFGLSLYLTYLMSWPLMMLLMARLLGRRELTYRGAVRCLCYASGINWLYCVPLIGMAAALYHFVVTSFCAGAMSRGTWLTGFVIYGVPTLLCGMGAVALYFALIFGVLATPH